MKKKKSGEVEKIYKKKSSITERLKRHDRLLKMDLICYCLMYLKCGKPLESPW